MRADRAGSIYDSTVSHGNGLLALLLCLGNTRERFSVFLETRGNGSLCSCRCHFLVNTEYQPFVFQSKRDKKNRPRCQVLSYNSWPTSKRFVTLSFRTVIVLLGIFHRYSNIIKITISYIVDSSIYVQQKKLIV